MYSRTKRATRFQTFVAAVLIAASIFFFTPPKQADAIVLLIVLGTATTVTLGAVLTAIIIDGIILCALGVICGGGTAGNCTLPVGTTCRSEENQCGDFNTGEIQSDCTCSVGPPSDWTGDLCPTNYCGLDGGGQVSCDGTCVGGGIPSLYADMDAWNLGTCVGLELPEDAIVIEPPLVREGDFVTVRWDLGLNYPPGCTLTGPGVDRSFTASEATGRVENVPVSGPHRYTITCDDVTASEDVNILPDISDS